MSEYNSLQYRTWYESNKERIRPLKTMAKKKYRRTDAGRAAQRRYNAKPSRKLYVQGYRFKKRYGITVEEYNNMVNERNSCCDICKVYETMLHVDHSHETGKVRGLLCGSCNRALGLLKDNVSYLKIAIDYLKNV